MIAPSGALSDSNALTDPDITNVLPQKMSEIVAVASRRTIARRSASIRDFCENDIRFVPCADNSVRH